MNNIWPILNLLRKDYYDLGFCKLPIEDTPDVRWMLGCSFNDILGAKVLGSNLFDEGPYEFGHVQIKRDDIVFDIGANLGLFTALACDRQARVYAVEPLPANIISLEKFQRLNPSFNFDIVPVALSNYNGTGTFYACSTDRGLATLSNVEVDNSQAVYDEISEVKIQTLDSLAKELNLNKVDFIKCDIEGGEENMLLGATEVLREFRPKLAICTYHTSNTKERIEEIVLNANPRYIISHAWRKMYAY